jgi:hypothetical protein
MAMNRVEASAPSARGGSGMWAWAAVAVLLTGASVLGGCASGGSASARYPRRPPGCELAVYHTAVPGLAAWDDLGVAEAVCNIGIPVAECLRMLRAEACRMGGDVLYNVPYKPFRPRDQVMQFRGQVAHTRQPGAKHDESDASDERTRAKVGVNELLRGD